MILERILQLLKTFEYILNKLKQIQNPESREQYNLQFFSLKFQLSLLTALLTMHMVKIKEIKPPMKFNIKVKSIDKNTLTQLVNNDTKLVEGSQKCHNLVLALLYYRYLQLGVILENGEKSPLYT
ncbi:hypothetical protein [Cryptosporidium hominis TU502]|uniref:hypothetical protein n=1 Tax=Cryptosporidium hominis (strain TU502) TaxID=353151 RepID=UPI0000452F02|nr:hypothetical protein [Cryptosporidium hominis TU502]